MKTILYNPIFINPQAYYVFPRLTRYLQPDNESTAEPANYIGTIEVKVIAYGDTTLKRTYTNTDSIDLSEFKNTWIRISLFTKVGSCVLGEWKIGNMESDLPYIDPEVLASLKAVVIVGNKTNNDSDRAIVKNLVDPDNPFVISNAAYTEGSGYADKGSPYYGAFVTDGINDLITSTKTVQEMGITDEVTVVSMIHQIDLNSTYTIATTNYIENSNSREHVRSDVYNYGKTGIYGYSASLINNTKSDIKNILGDEADYYVKSTNSLQTIFDAKFSVVGRISELTEASQVAWYWTIIANKVLTTDQINQVIAYFNLDRTLKPDILCDVKKQGITNDNHAEFGDKLIDFSGNGRDIQLNNIAWKGDSGIGKYEVDFLDSSIWHSSNSTITSSKIDCKNAISHIMLLYYSVGSKEYPDIPSFKVIKTGADIDYSYIDETGSPKLVRIVDGVNVLPASHNTLYSGSGRFCGFGNPGMGNSVTITQIPSHAGGLCLDGVNDFGKVTGMPVYKDYTVVADYERFYLEPITGGRASILSKSSKVGDGSFIFNLEDQDGGKACYTFGEANGNISDDITRIIRYQSKYYNTKTLSIGTAEDNDFMVLGKVREVDSRHFCGAIYSLMSFPYSMSEFLIERQLKKHKLGTLYADMVEFRPIIKSNIDILKINYWDKDWNVVNVGDYVSVGNDIKTNITVPNGYKVSKVTSDAFDNITIEKSSTDFIYDVKFYGIKKSPQKIGITIEQDENYVLFNPVINSNYDNYKLTFHLREYEKLINIGDYIPKGTYIRANLYLKNNIDELVTFTFNGVNIDYVKSPFYDLAYNIGQIYNYDSPQEVNITIDEYIRYEEIVQPYPSIINLVSIDKTHFYTYGDKLKVGDVILYNSYKNLLKGLYSLNGQLKYNGVYIYDIDGRITVAKEMVFSWTVSPTWLLDNNEPKCILSPSRLRIPNSSYKLLGYIPDISGHGNHGVIHNSAYEGASGANGYLQNFSEWTKASGVSSTDSVISSSNNLVAANGWIAYVTSGTVIPTFKVEISGIPVNGNLRFEGSDQTLVNGVNTIQGITTTKVTGFYISSGYDNDWSNLKIEQIGEYEGAYCFDGVDDFVTIPTTVGGKQVLMKVNWQKSPTLLYDQRASGSFAVLTTLEDDAVNPRIAYQARNQDGKTYIDGIENNYIETYTLKDITHNITIANSSSGGVIVPVIGCNTGKTSSFAKMSLYDFMLFDEISTDDKILELNEYVGIEGNTE